MRAGYRGLGVYRTPERERESENRESVCKTGSRTESNDTGDPAACKVVECTLQ